MPRYKDLSGFPYKKMVVIWLLLTCTDTETGVTWYIMNISWLFWHIFWYNGNIVEQYTCVPTGSIRDSVKAALHWI